MMAEATGISVDRAYTSVAGGVDGKTPGAGDVSCEESPAADLSVVRRWVFDLEPMLLVDVDPSTVAT